MKYYTGVGSRKTPKHICVKMFNVASMLGSKGWILRSGHADGADVSFESGCDIAGGQKEIYIPWKGFNNSDSLLYNTSHEAFEIASRIHPIWNELKPSVQKLHARNVHQVLGLDLKTPSRVVYFWADPKNMGGTRTAVLLAREHKIPCYNFFTRSYYD